VAVLRSVPPDAAVLSASMRDLGYSPEAAVADIIDNSISAGASEISIFCNQYLSQSVFAIIDNGCGMDAEQLVCAMRLGADTGRRPKHDLGKFGLGLKTASFSQCRQLTVISSRDGKRCGAEWDLDIIDQKNDWMMAELNDEDISQVPFTEHLPRTGTLVVWQKLDRFSSKKDKTFDPVFINERMMQVDKHLGLVFQRFLSNESGRKKITIRINNDPVRPFDPFCLTLNAQQLPEEKVLLKNEHIIIRAYILPHSSRMPAQELERLQKRSPLIQDQGVYIYRNRRLLSKGGWFNLIPRTEAMKLARVQIDYTDALDDQWVIDVKKSRAHPPQLVKERLRQLLPRIAESCSTVNRGRGQWRQSGTTVPFWNRVSERKGIRYLVNPEHPLVVSVKNRLDQPGMKLFQLLLESAAATLPLEMIYADYASASTDMIRPLDIYEDVKKKLKVLKELLPQADSDDPQIFIDMVRSTGLFEACMEEVEQIIKGEDL